MRSDKLLEVREDGYWNIKVYALTSMIINGDKTTILVDCVYFFGNEGRSYYENVNSLVNPNAVVVCSHFCDRIGNLIKIGDEYYREIWRKSTCPLTLHLTKCAVSDRSKLIIDNRIQEALRHMITKS